jgi:hypothetical protein
MCVFDARVCIWVSGGVGTPPKTLSCENRIHLHINIITLNVNNSILRNSQLYNGFLVNLSSNEILLYTLLSVI